ncbi:hypothetical protein ANCCAN_12291 [Ancylostoma caninum]|uniref:Uncharacterized protein n=1 Tax=Ancylostoma caninum TaxID=29170 RepID=A0A368GFC7_ANCCA|nr:hypothetical protein ANCCAN_12291 [Ancylostoma caninum]
MEPRLAAGRQAIEQRVEPCRQNVSGKAGENAAALADQLVLEFLVVELTEPQAAQLAKTAGDGAQLQFISTMFDRDPILERLAAVGSQSQLTMRCGIVASELKQCSSFCFPELAASSDII